jgi:hypothetical protein
MPLSEHEQRILAELEESLSKQDPRFAKNVRETTVYSHSGRRVRWGVLGFVAGLALMWFTFSQSVFAGLVGIAIMFASLILIERNVRRVGRATWQDLTRSLRGEDGERQSMEDRRNTLREWLERRRRNE